MRNCNNNYTQFSKVGNYVSELGHYQKQSAAWFQAKTAQTTLRGNVFFNGPRAGINFNDGFGGGNVIEHNLVFNFCRESSDHGPFNSWVRVRDRSSFSLFAESVSFRSFVSNPTSWNIHIQIYTYMCIYMGWWASALWLTLLYFCIHTFTSFFLSLFVGVGVVVVVLLYPNYQHHCVLLWTGPASIFDRRCKPACAEHDSGLQRD